MRANSPRVSLFRQSLWALLRVAAVLVVMMWLLAGLAAAAFHWAIVPRLPLWQPAIERWVSDTLGAPVRMQSLRALEQNGASTIEVQGLEVLDAQGQVALHLTRASVQLSARSLLNFGFDALRAEGLSVEVQRLISGQWVIAGVALPQSSATSSADLLNWVFRQTHWRVVDGSVRWRDAWLANKQGLTSVPELRLSGVQAVLHNSGRRHELRIDATPSLSDQHTWTLQADVQSPRLSRASGDWQKWSGTVYWHFADVDLAQLSQHLDSAALWGVSAHSGRGDWRAWLDVNKGRALGVTNDWAMRDVQVSLGAKLKPLALDTLQGRLIWYQAENGVRLETQNLAFHTRDGLVWPGGNVQWRWQPATDRALAQSHFTALDLDLATLAQVATRLPLDERTHAWLQALAPSGRVDALQAEWSGPLDQPQRMSVQGKVRGLGLKAGDLSARAARGVLARPGVQGLNVSFKTTESAGSAHLVMEQGSWNLPGVWEQPQVDMDSVRTDLSWSRTGGLWQVSAQDLHLANADVAASGRVTWRQGQGAGKLDLDLTAERANLAKLARYLPRVLDPDALRYVRAAVQRGEAKQVKVRIQGPVDSMPYAKASQGQFFISGEVSGVQMDVAPASITGQQWPALSELSGVYTLDRTRMVLNGVSAKMAQVPALTVTMGEAHIDDLLGRPQLGVQLQAHGPLQHWLKGVRTTALNTLTRGTFQEVQAQGDGRLSLDLAMPLVGHTDPQVKGRFGFAKAAVQWGANLPVVTQAQGDVQFGADGVQAKVASAQALGGPLKIDVKLDAQGDLSAQLNGEANADALRQLPELQSVRGVMKSVQGRLPYSAKLNQRGSAPVDWSVESSLQGLSLALPEPLNKTAAASWPLRVAHQGAAAETTLALGPLQDPVVSARLRQNAQKTGVQGVVAVGQALSAVPTRAGQLVAGVRLAKLDVDAWRDWWTQAQATQSTPSQSQAAAPLTPASPVATAVQGPSVTKSTGSSPLTLSAWLPTQVNGRVGSLQAAGWPWHGVTLDAQRQDMGGRPGWRAEVQAEELQGTFQVEPGTEQAPDGRVFARLKHLNVISGDESETGVGQSLWDQPRGMPALDIHVDALTLNGRAWGQVDLLARNTLKNQGARVLRQWQLERLDVTLPEAKLRAHGDWVPEETGFAQAAQGLWRRTQLDLAVEVSDSGALLSRFGMPGVVKGGVGQLSGRLAWRGAPVKLDKASLSGQLKLDIGRGQFLKADPGIAKLLGVLSLQSLPRRLLFDFRDVFQQGFAFDSIKGNAQVNKGVLTTRDLTTRGPSASVLMEGSADVVQETQDLRVVVLPELDAGTLSVWAALTNPVLGLASYVVQKVFGDALANANTRAFHITGSWSDPKVEALLPESQEPAPVRTPQTPNVPPLPRLQPAG